MKKIYAVILAAGMSNRLGYNKLTLTVNEERVIHRSVRAFSIPEIDRVFVVTGPDIHAIRECVSDLPVEMILNADYGEGMASSVRAALPFVFDADGVFFHLGDVPLVSQKVIDTMLNEFVKNSGKIIVPSYEGRNGHPVLIDIRSYHHEIGTLHGDRGLKEILERHPEDIFRVRGEVGNILDIDTVDDIRELRERGYRIEKG